MCRRGPLKVQGYVGGLLSGFGGSCSVFWEFCPAAPSSMIANNKGGPISQVRVRERNPRLARSRTKNELITSAKSRCLPAASPATFLTAPGGPFAYELTFPIFGSEQDVAKRRIESNLKSVRFGCRRCKGSTAIRPGHHSCGRLIILPDAKSGV
jgi:hypothetical protein